MAEEMTRSEIFEIAYDGEPVDDGSMDVREFAPSVMALGDIFDAANEVIFEGKVAPYLKIRSDFKHASFDVTFELGQTIISGLMDMFGSKEASAISNMLSILGIPGGVGLIALVVGLKGQKPKSTKSISGDRILVESVDGRTMEIPKSLWSLYLNPKARRALAAFVKPLKQKGMRAIRIGKKKSKPQIIEQQQADYFDVPKDKESEDAFESEKLLKVMTVHFKDGPKWRFTDGDSPLNASMGDSDFLKKVDAGLKFSSGDVLRVVMRTTQWMENGDLKANHEVIRVLEHRKPDGEQQKMDLLPPA